MGRPNSPPMDPILVMVKVPPLARSATYSSPHNDIYDSWDGAWVGAYYPPTEYTYDVVFLEAKLFDVKSEELVWAASTETADPGKVDREIAKYTSIILGALRRDGLLGK